MKRSIYLIQNDDTQHIKIGIGKKPEQRIKQLQTGSSAKLTLLYQIEVEYASKVERVLHRHFAEQRVHGEWFNLQGVKLDDITKQIIITEKNYISLNKYDNPFV